MCHGQRCAIWQVVFMLLFTHLIFLPVVLVQYTDEPYMAATLSFLSIQMFFALELTAREIENCFGMDANDLDLQGFQYDFNVLLDSLIMETPDAALKQGFRMAGLINADDKYPNITIDTIVLLSDGAPTDNSYPAAKLMYFNIILEHVREWNKRKQVVIHCIAVDMQPGNEFMSKLAEENGGTFVDR